MLNVSYNFYYHLNPDFPKEKIIESINQKDFNTFIKIYNAWKDEEFCYLPNTALAYADEDYDHMVAVDILNEYNFKEITYCEYECG